MRGDLWGTQRGCAPTLSVQPIQLATANAPIFFHPAGWLMCDEVNASFGTSLAALSFLREPIV
jgi:hypothetical protein